MNPPWHVKNDCKRAAMAHVSLITAVPAVPPRQEPARPEVCVLSPHMRCSVCQGGFLTSLCPLDAAPPYTCVFLPQAPSRCRSWCGRSQGAGEQLPLRGDSASSRPSAPQNPHRDIFLMAGRDTFPSKGRIGQTLGQVQVGCSFPRGQGLGWPTHGEHGVHSHTERRGQKHRFSPMIAWHTVSQALWTMLDLWHGLFLADY